MAAGEKRKAVLEWFLKRFAEAYGRYREERNEVKPVVWRTKRNTDKCWGRRGAKIMRSKKMNTLINPEITKKYIFIFKHVFLLNTLVSIFPKNVLSMQRISINEFMNMSENTYSLRLPPSRK